MGYAGDNFVRYTGDTITMAQTQRKTYMSLFFFHSFIFLLIIVIITSQFIRY